MGNKGMQELFLIFSNIIALFFIQEISGLWCFKCSEFDGELRCPKYCDSIEKWKNCSCENHYIESDSEDDYCIIGSIGQTIKLQVSVPNPVLKY